MEGLSAPLAHVVLHEPEIPNNTGNIGRTCVALGASLHLIHPLGFDIDEKACRRAGLDYWPRLSVREHESFERYREDAAPPRLWALTTRATRSVFDVDLRRGDHVLFGRESRGLPDALLDAVGDRCVSLPMLAGERSLNLSNAVCVVLYEIARRAREAGEATIDAGGRLRLD
ncbi:MAG: tRNA (uridine(34)/cytosine(34)/5-carboxymethylaminomethyluridine(34)-2'-O)-methyltransferase TrmL [Phycisphaerae bacterium]|nr:tRNA (uridine(34)/cytosine(34)/5-carboxymethylaminomethyluridine(34)-2'-O)-methyltransferase TrmL [Phycisphaerae bacterium]